MKKVLKCLAVIAVVAFSLVACGDKTQNNNVQNENQPEVRQEDTNQQTASAIEERFKQTANGTELKDSTILTEEKISEMYGDALKNVEFSEIRSVETEEKIEEMGIAKMSNSEEIEMVQELFAKRYDDLLEKYKEDIEMTKLLNEPDMFSLIARNGYVVYVISESASEKLESIVNDVTNENI